MKIIGKKIRITNQDAKSALVTLGKVRKLFGPTGNGWTTGAMYRKNFYGHDRYCLLGAIRKANGLGETVLVHMVERSVPEGGIAAFNDGFGRGTANTRFSNVKKLLDRVERKFKRVLAK